MLNTICEDRKNLGVLSGLYATVLFLLQSSFLTKRLTSFTKVINPEINAQSSLRLRADSEWSSLFKPKTGTFFLIAVQCP